MEFDSCKPIYIQITEYIKRRIVSGEQEPGSKMAAVREMAIEMGVNPNTMQKALSALEQEGLVYTERTSGRFVTTDTEQILKLKLEMLETEAEEFAKNVSALGCTQVEALSVLDKIMNKGE